MSPCQGYIEKDISTRTSEQAIQIFTEGRLTLREGNGYNNISSSFLRVCMGIVTAAPMCMAFEITNIILPFLNLHHTL